MTTVCLNCMVSTGVGEMSGTVGLPSLDEEPRGRGNHPLSKVLSSGGDADTDETFGYIESGFRALGVRVYSFDRYRAFLEEHSGHRLFEWAAGMENDDQIPEPLRGEEDKTKFLGYKPPLKTDGYVRGTLAFVCPKCEDQFDEGSPDWVMPFEDTVITPDQIKLFRKRVGVPSECCIHEAEPFDILYTDLEEWLDEHKSHKVVMRLDKEKA